MDWITDSKIFPEVGTEVDMKLKTESGEVETRGYFFFNTWGNRYIRTYYDGEGPYELIAWKPQVII